MAKYDIRINKGSDRVIKLGLHTWGCPCVSEDVDVTDYKARMHIRESVDAEEKLDELTTENGRLVLDGSFLYIWFPNTVTEKYGFRTAFYDLELVSPAGYVTRLMEGKVYTRDEVTR